MSSDFIDYGCKNAYTKGIQWTRQKCNKGCCHINMQSLYKMPKKYFEQFGMVVGDETHLSAVKSLTSILTKLHLCKYRFGLTGTLDGMQTHRLVLEGLFATPK